MFWTEKHRKFLNILLAYTIVLALLYIIMPVTYELSWLSYFEPVRNGYLPYVDFHVGYPPLGFLPFLGLAFLSNFDLMSYAILMRITNTFFLLVSVLLVYLAVYKVRGERDAILSALMVMVSVSTISYNRHSNESIPLFFALLALYFMLDGKPRLTGLAIGLGAMAKILPILLIIPAMKRFKLAKERVQLLGFAYVSILLLNLPFMIANPFMWLGVYLYHGIRGPWETIWAILEGWYGHGGAEALHPYFEGFFTYMQLQGIYQPSPHDHAYYAWNYPWLTTLLFILGGAMLLLSYYLINEHDILEGAALTLFSFMFFSKGYSPQYVIFMLPFIAMAFEGTKKICFWLMFEVGAILQWILWMPGIYSPSLLAFMVILRTITFALVIIVLMMHFMRRQKVLKLPSFRSQSIGGLKDKFLAIFIVSILIAGSSAYYLIDHYSQFPQTVQTYNGTIDIKLHETVHLLLLKLTKGDRVMLNLTSTSPNNVFVSRGDDEVWTTKTPQYDVRDLFISNELADYPLVIYMAYPVSYFKVIDETRGDGRGEIKQMSKALNVSVIDFGRDDSESLLRLSWPVDLVVSDDFKVRMMVRHFSGHVNRTLLGVSSLTANDVYDYEIFLSDEWREFEMNSSSVTFDGRTFSYHKGDRIDAINIVFVVEDGKNASIGLKDLEVLNEGRTEKLDLETENKSQISYNIYVAHKYSLTKPVIVYALYSLLTLGTTTAWLSLYKKFEKSAKSLS